MGILLYNMHTDIHTKTHTHINIHTHTYINTYIELNPVHNLWAVWFYTLQAAVCINTLSAYKIFSCISRVFNEVLQKFWCCKYGKSYYYWVHQKQGRSGLWAVIGMKWFMLLINVMVAKHKVCSCWLLSLLSNQQMWSFSDRASNAGRNYSLKPFFPVVI